MSPYTITPATIGPAFCVAYTHHASLTDMQRGNAIARALGGLYVRDLPGWRFSGPRSKWWATLFDAGFNAVRKYRPQPVDVWMLDGQEMPLYKALAKGRKMAGLSKEPHNVMMTEEAVS